MTPHAFAEVQEALVQACQRRTDGSDMSVEIDLEELGHVRIAATREAAGIRLALTVDSSASASVFEAQSHALMSVLHQGGVAVAGLQVQVGHDRGTGFARKKDNQSMDEAPKGVRGARDREGGVDAASGKPPPRPMTPDSTVDVMA